MRKNYALHNQYLSLVVEQQNQKVPIFRYFGKRLANNQLESNLNLIDTGIEQGSHDHYVGLPIINNLDSGCFAYRNLTVSKTTGYPLINLQCFDVVQTDRKLKIKI